MKKIQWKNHPDKTTKISADNLNTMQNNIEEEINSKWSKVYPVGSVYMSFDVTSPANIYGGTWEQLKGRFLLGTGSPDDNTSNWCGSLNNVSNDGWDSTGDRAGQFRHQLTRAELPNERLKVLDARYLPREVQIGSFDGPGFQYGQAWPQVGLGDSKYSGEGLVTQPMGNDNLHNNMPPYITVNIWRRTA